MVSNTIKELKDRKQTVEQKGIRGDLKEQESWLLTVEVEKAGCLLLSPSPACPTFLFEASS